MVWGAGISREKNHSVALELERPGKKKSSVEHSSEKRDERRGRGKKWLRQQDSE